MKDYVIIGFGFIAWIVTGFLLYPPIVQLILNQEYPAYLNELFFLLQFIIIGLVIGFFGKMRGWKLGLILGLIIAIVFVLFSLTSPVDAMVNQKFESISAILFSHSIFTIYLIIGGHFGEWIKNKLQNGE